MKKWFVGMMVLVVLAFGAGMIGKSTFRNVGVIDIENMEDIRELNCNVNQIFEEETVDMFIPDNPTVSFKLMAKQVTVMVVKPTNVIRQYNFTMTQEVEVIEVINGEVEEGDIVEIVSSGGVFDQAILKGLRHYENDRPVQYSFVNLMFEDNYYLVFAEALDTNAYSETKRYREAFTFSQWNLSSDYSKPIDVPLETIAYNDYENSEFLCDTQETVDKLVAFKNEVLQAILTEEQLLRYRGTGN